MIDEKIDLAVAFLQSQPSSAAAVLEEQPIERVAEFLLSVSFKQSAAVLNLMLPQYTARLCRFVDPVICAGFLSEMDVSHIAAILRHSENDRAQDILGHLPERTKLTCNLLLNYADSAVGAWMSTSFISLPTDCNVGEARSRLASAGDISNADTVYVVDRERYLQGKIDVIDLLKSSAKSELCNVMQSAPDAVSGRASLASVANNEVWHHSECVAVINRNRQLVGVLRHLDLRKGIAGLSTTIDEPRERDPLWGIWEVYGSTLATLFSTVGEAVSIRKR